MKCNNKSAFTMLELIFVVVIIGILSAIAIPKFAVTRNDAVIAKAKTTVAAVRNAVATERQKRILKGDFTHPITGLGAGLNVFDRFNADRDHVANRVLDYALPNCVSLGRLEGCWTSVGTVYTYHLPVTGTTVAFNLASNRFDCARPASLGCRRLTQ